LYTFNGIKQITTSDSLIKTAKNNKLSMTSMNIFIPRILSNISKNNIKDTFKQMNIGNVTYIDMRKRLNESRSHYSFAFLNVELLNTPKSNEISDRININGSTQLYYDDEHYWELKNYIPREERCSTTYLEIDELCKLLTKVPTSFSESDRNMMNDEFDELQCETDGLLEISNAIHEKPKIVPRYYSLF
jgi:hypothetical protein